MQEQKILQFVNPPDSRTPGVTSIPVTDAKDWVQSPCLSVTHTHEKTLMEIVHTHQKDSIHVDLRLSHKKKGH